MGISKKEHLKVVLGSLNKAFKNARRKGTFTVRDLFFLNCIYKTIKNSCLTEATSEQLRTLELFYYRQLNSSIHFCKQDLESNAFVSISGDNGFISQGGCFIGGHRPEVGDFTLGDGGEVLNESTQGIFAGEFESEFE